MQSNSKVFPGILSFVLFFLVFSPGCKKDENNAGRDIEAIWIGTWTDQSGVKGKFLSSVYQDGISFDGEVAIRIDSLYTQSYNSDFNGSVKNGNLWCSIDISGVKIGVEGNFPADSSVEGNFKVPLLSMSGDFSGEKIPSEDCALKEIYTYSPAEGGNRILDIVAVDNELWIFRYPYTFVNDTAVLPVTIIDFNGNIINETWFPYASSNWVYDGSYLWSIFNGNELYKYNRNRVLEKKTEMQQMHGSGLAVNKEKIYLTNDVFRVVETDSLFSRTEMHDLGALPIHNLTCFQDHFLCTYSDAVFILDAGFSVTGALRIPQHSYVTKLTTNNEKAWILVETFIPSGSMGYSVFHVYEVPGVK